MTVSERLFMIMDSQKLKAIDLASILNINASVISMWKKRNTSPPTDYLLQICEFLDVTVSYLLTGESENKPAKDISQKYLSITEFSNSDYLNSVLHIANDSIGVRFKSARESSGISRADAAARSYISEDALRNLEESGKFTTDKIGADQLACLAYLYDTDLYWLLCGKVRPPAAIIQNGEKVYPPYLFMLGMAEQKAAPKDATAHEETEEIAEFKSSLTDDERDILYTYALMSDEGKRIAHFTMQGIVAGTTNLGSSRQLGTKQNSGRTA